MGDAIAFEHSDEMVQRLPVARVRVGEDVILGGQLCWFDELDVPRTAACFRYSISSSALPTFPGVNPSAMA